MRIVRPAPLAMNKPHRIFGKFDPKGLNACVLVFAMGLLCMIKFLFFGLAIVALSFLSLGGVYLYGNHKLLITTLWRALWQKARYEPTRRDVFRLEIK
jgi:hypothetical protein